MKYQMPEPAIPASVIGLKGVFGPMYTAEQMQAAWDAGRVAGLEEAAKDLQRHKNFIEDMCNETFDRWTTGYQMQRIALNIKDSYTAKETPCA